MVLLVAGRGLTSDVLGGLQSLHAMGVAGIAPLSTQSKVAEKGYRIITMLLHAVVARCFG